MGQLDGQVAVITGGGTGIGKAIARAFASEGCDVVIAARNKDRLEAAADEIRQHGHKVLTVQTDVTNSSQVRSLFEKVNGEFGRLDILVNNAGVIDGGRIDQVTDEQWASVIGANVTGPFYCTREAFKVMMKQRRGRVINIGSIAAQRPREHSSPYTTSKNAIWGLTQSAALDGREFGIAVSCLHPGNTMVERRADGRSRSGKDMGPEILISADDIARTALLMVTLPPETVMLEAIVMPIQQKYLGRG